MFVFSVVEKILLLNVGLFAQESAETCSVLLDVCKLIVTKDPGFMKFGEGLSGPNAPLTWAHSYEGICVLTPFDKLFDCKADFVSPSGGELLKEFGNENMFLEHWGLDCKLMSRARGRPIKLAPGRWIEGPRAMRSDDYPLGLPWLPGHAQARIRRSNGMFTFSLNRLKRRLKSLGVAIIEHPFRSFGWQFPLALELFNCFQFYSLSFGVVLEAREKTQLSFTIVRTCTKLYISLNVLAIS